MAFHKSRPLAFIIYSWFIVFLADARSWDLAVTIGKEITFFASNGTMTGHIKAREALDLSGIAYDEIKHIMFLSDTANKNSSIFIKNLGSKDNETQSLLNSDHKTYITGLAYDAKTQNIYWSDTLGQAIMSTHVPSSNKSAIKEPKILIELPNKDPRGISLDMCNRRLYWANSNKSNPSIESSNLDGSDIVTVINTNLYEPLGIAVDHWSAKLYWIDDEEGIFFKIERSNFDGSDRELLVHGRHQLPYNIAVDREAIYWSDWTAVGIWSMKKNATAGEGHYMWARLHDTYRKSDPKSIVARDNIGDINCSSMLAIQRKNLAGSNDKKTRNENDEDDDNNLITSTEVGDSIAEISPRCLNGGTYDESNDLCNCNHGFEGSFCERSKCHNYCFHGECSVSADGQPHCKCHSSYQGQRCESSICDGYCLNDGACSIKNHEPFCVCKSTFGSRCENAYDIKEVCAMFCASQLSTLSSIDTSSCSCIDGNQTSASLTSAYNNKEPWNKTLIIIFATLLGILTIVVGVLSYYVNKLRRRPRIRKRFVVSKTGITPLTARPQLPSDQCEIMIENCCNMNICETPCFEPKLRNGEQNGRKKEEKKTLLDNMDGNSC